MARKLGELVIPLGTGGATDTYSYDLLSDGGVAIVAPEAPNTQSRQAYVYDSEGVLEATISGPPVSAELYAGSSGFVLVGIAPASETTPYATISVRGFDNDGVITNSVTLAGEPGNPDYPRDVISIFDTIVLSNGNVVVGWRSGYAFDLNRANVTIFSSDGALVRDLQGLSSGEDSRISYLYPTDGGGFAVGVFDYESETSSRLVFSSTGDLVASGVKPLPATTKWTFDDGGFVELSFQDGRAVGQEFSVDGRPITDLFVIESAADDIARLSFETLDDGRYNIAWVTDASDGRAASLLVRQFARFDAGTTATPRDDDLGGTAEAEAISGLGGDDVVFGFAGDDVLDGGAGADMMYGGEGNDVYVVDGVRDEVGEFADRGDDTVFASVDFTLGLHVENLFLTTSADLAGIGNDRGNRITGNDGANRLEGGDGDDILIGGDGADTLMAIDPSGNRRDDLTGGLGDDAYYIDRLDIVREAAGEGFDTVFTVGSGLSIQIAVLANIERTGLLSAGYLVGDARSNRLVGSSGDDRLDGGAGADQMAGGAGFDTYYIDDANDRIYDDGGGIVTSIEFRLGATNFRDLTVTGRDDLKLEGNALDNTLRGNDGANVLYGGLGADFMSGLGGNDTYWIDNVGDRIEETDGRGTDTVLSTISFDMAGIHVEHLTLRGVSNVNGYGNSKANIIVGNAGHNVLDGRAGSDTMRGGAGNDTYYVSSTRDVVTELSGQGADSVFASVSYGLAGTYVEALTLTGLADLNATGNSLENTLTGNIGANVLDGGKGRDVLFGGFGNDTLLGGTGDDVLTGGFGADTLDGGAGADRYTFASIVETSLAESDTIRTLEAGDRIDLSAIDADGLDDGDDAFALVSAFSSQRGQATLSYDAESSRTALLLDIDGDGAADARVWITGQVTALDTSLF